MSERRRRDRYLAGPLPLPTVKPEAARTIRLLRAAIAVVAVFALGGTAWLIGTAVLNPDVQTRRPGWFDGAFEVPFWIPLILTFLVGCAAVAAVYVRAARRVQAGEDLFENGFREQRRRSLQRARDRLREETGS